MSDTTTVAGSTGIPSYEEYLEQMNSNVRKANKNLGQNEFLQLMAAQLQYQDPLEPTKDTDFIAQLAQFQTLEQLSGLTTMTSNSYYYGLAGKYVYAEVTLDNGENTVIHGVVDRVALQDGKYWVQVGDYLVDATKITQVYDKELFIGGNPLLETTSLIGKEVTADVVGEDGKTETLTGIVTRVAVENGILTAYLDHDENKKAQVGQITDIREPAPPAEAGEDEDGEEAGTEASGGTVNPEDAPGYDPSLLGGGSGEKEGDEDAGSGVDTDGAGEEQPA